MAHQVSGWQQIVQTLNKHRAWAIAVPGANSRDEDRCDHGFSFTLEYTIDGALAVLQQLLSGKGCAMPADHNKALRKQLPGELRQIQNLRHICQIIAGEGDRIRAPAFEQSKVIPMRFCLEVNDLDLVPRLPGGC